MTNCWNNHSRAKQSRAMPRSSSDLPPSPSHFFPPLWGTALPFIVSNKKKRNRAQQALEQRSVNFCIIFLVNEEHHTGCFIISSQWTDWGITSGLGENGYGHGNAKTTLSNYISNRYVCRVAFFPATLSVLCSADRGRRFVFISVAPFNSVLTWWDLEGMGKT